MSKPPRSAGMIRRRAFVAGAVCAAALPSPTPASAWGRIYVNDEGTKILHDGHPLPNMKMLVRIVCRSTNPAKSGFETSECVTFVDRALEPGDVIAWTGRDLRIVSFQTFWDMEKFAELSALKKESDHLRMRGRLRA